MKVDKKIKKHKESTNLILKKYKMIFKYKSINPILKHHMKSHRSLNESRLWNFTEWMDEYHILLNQLSVTESITMSIEHTVYIVILLHLQKFQKLWAFF